jgi:hypothetical protein
VLNVKVKVPTWIQCKHRAESPSMGFEGFVCVCWWGLCVFGICVVYGWDGWVGVCVCGWVCWLVSGCVGWFLVGCVSVGICVGGWDRWVGVCVFLCVCVLVGFVCYLGSAWWMGGWGCVWVGHVLVGG